MVDPSKYWQCLTTMKIYLFPGWKIHTWLLTHSLGLPHFLHVLSYSSLVWWCLLWFVFQLKTSYQDFSSSKKKQSFTKRKATGWGQHTLLSGQSAHRHFEAATVLATSSPPMGCRRKKAILCFKQGADIVGWLNCCRRHIANLHVQKVL